VVSDITLVEDALEVPRHIIAEWINERVGRGKNEGG